MIKDDLHFAHRHVGIRFVFAAWIGCFFVAASAQAATYTVTSNTDNGTGGTPGTLSWAINQANTNGGQDTIAIDASVGTINMSGSLPMINGDTTVQGNNTTIVGSNNRLFFVNAGTVALQNLNVTGGQAKGGDGGSDALNGGGGGLGAGGGLFVNQGANVTLESVTFNNNAAVGGNGGSNPLGVGGGGGAGGGGFGGNGGIGGPLGGAGGGGFNTNGGDGGTFTGGGGGGLVGNGNNGTFGGGGTGSPPGGNGGDSSVAGADGGTFGGGGGGGSSANGGNGGDFAGGGGSGQDGVGGNGGFGGGGAGSTFQSAGTGGFGAGDGGLSAPGNGGSGFGGAVFVRAGGSLTILDSTTTGNSVTAGAAGGPIASSGQAAGQDLYVMNGVNANFGGASNNFSGSISGAGSVTIQSTATTTFSGVNNYSGGTTVSGGSALSGNSNSLQGTISNGGTVTFNQSFNGTYAGDMSGSGALVKSGTGELTLGGTNNYSGGTTVSGGKLIGNSNSLQGDITNNAQVVFNQPTDGTYSGVMSGTGSLTVQGTGVFTLTGNNNYSGGTTIQGPQLTGTTSSIQGNITNNSALVFNQLGTTGTYSGNISGNGGVTLLNGVLEFAGTNSYSGGTGVYNGRLIGNTNNLQQGIFAAVNATVEFNQATDGTYAGTMSGGGAFVKSGAGALTLSGTNNYTGSTSVEAGRLSVNGSLASSVQVSQGAVLGGNATINGNLTSSGTVAPGNSIGTLVVNGNYNAGSGAAQEVEINDAGNTPGVNNDLMMVSGTANINGSAVNVVATPGTYTLGTKFTFLGAGSITGSYSGATVTGDPTLAALLGYEDLNIGGIDYMTAYLMLIAAQTDYAAIAETPNQMAVAVYIDTHCSNLDLQDLITQLNTLTSDGQRAAFEQLGPQVTGTMAQLGVQNTMNLNMAISRQVRPGVTGYGGGTSEAANDSGNGEVASRGMSREAATFVANFGRQDDAPVVRGQQSNGDEFSAWVIGYGMGGVGQSDGNAAGGNYSTGGTLVALQRYLDDSMLLGVYGAYTSFSLSTDGPQQSANASDGQLGTFLRYGDDFSYWLMSASVGPDGYNTTRAINIGNIVGNAEADFGGWQSSLWLEKGVTLDYGGWSVQPLAALSYIFLHQNSYTETGPTIGNLHVADVNTNALRSVLGGYFGRSFGTSYGALRPEARAFWLHEFLEPETTVDSSFTAIGGPSFATQGLNFGRDWGVIGAGLNWSVTQQLSLFANYDLLINSQQSSNFGSGGLQYSW